MSNNIWQTIAATSWWFPVIIVSVTLIAYQSTKPQTIPAKIFKYNILYFLTLVIIGLVFFVNITPPGLLLCASLFIPGYATGWLRMRLRKTKAVKDQNMVFVQGTWLPILFLSAAAIAKYYYGFTFSLNLLHFKLEKYSLLLMATYGFITGLLIGRMQYVRRVVKSGPFVTA